MVNQKMELNMANVGPKNSTFRRAIAQGQILLSRESFLAVKENKNPKGNVLAVGEVAGIMAAKKTSDLIPLCHPLPLDHVKVSFTLDERSSRITAYCEVSTTAKTGVEMEALAGVNGALLSIYDLCKAVDPVITLSEIRLNHKEGGKRGLWRHPDNLVEHFPENPIECTSENAAPVASNLGSLDGVRSSVVTVSDRVYSGKNEDTSGPALVSLLVEAGAILGPLAVVPDEKRKIQTVIRRAIQENDSRLIITTGGTGLGPRDQTPEAIEEISDRLVPGFGEYLRVQGSRFTSSSWLSRSMAALVGNTLVITLPGSEKAVRECWGAMQSFLPHALHTLQGGSHD